MFRTVFQRFFHQPCVAALLLLLTPTFANAVVMLSPHDTYNLGYVPVGQSKEVLLQYDYSPYNFVRFFDAIQIPGSIGSKEESNGSPNFIETYSPDIEVSSENCPISASHNYCYRVRVTATDNPGVAAIRWMDKQTIYALFADGTEVPVSFADHEAFSVIKYSAVPLPAALWFGLTALVGLRVTSSRSVRVNRITASQ